MSSLCWQAGILSFGYGKAGRSIRPSDNYIGTVAEENDATIYTLDRCFEEIQSHIDITLLRRRDRHNINRHKKGNNDWL